MGAGPRPHEIPTADGPLPGLLWIPEGVEDGRAVPGLVVFQEIFGLSEFVRSRCEDLARLGYAVLAPAIYARLGENGQEAPEGHLDEAGQGDQAGPEAPAGQGAEAGREALAGQGDGAAPEALTGPEALVRAAPVVEPSEPEFLERAMGLVSQVDWPQAVRDGLAARDALAGMAGVDEMRVGLVGFCFGGGLAFNVAASAAQAQVPVAALVSYYGSALPGLLDLAEVVDCPSLHHFGTADSYIPMEQVEQIREAVTAGGTREQVRFELHEGADHAFDNPHPMFHHPEASATAWAQTEAFLTQVLDPHRA